MAVRTSAPRLAVTTPVPGCVHQSGRMRVVDMFRRVVWCCSSAMGCKADAGPVHYAEGEQLDVLRIDSPLHEWTSCWLQATTPLEPSNCHTDLADRTKGMQISTSGLGKTLTALGSRLRRHCMTSERTAFGSIACAQHTTLFAAFSGVVAFQKDCPYLCQS